MQKIRLFHHFILDLKVDLKILQSDWLRRFWAISQEQEFFQVWGLCKNTAVNIKHLCKPNSEKKIMT